MFALNTCKSLKKIYPLALYLFIIENLLNLILGKWTFTKP